MSAAIRAGRAFVELFLKDAQLQAGLNAAKVKMQAWKASAEAMGVKMLGLGVAMVTPFAMATKAAGDMAETMSKLKVMFGSGFGDVDAWLDKFSAAVGRSKKESADAVGAFQAMFVGMGAGSKEAGEMSKEMTALAIDFASFHNITDAEAIERLVSAFSGSSQVLDMFGINIKESNLNLKLLEMGFETCQGGATEFQKILARQEIIRETMGKQGAIGDAIRTADQFQGTYKRVAGEVTTAIAQIGEMVMPVFRDLMQWFSQSLKGVMEWADKNKEMVAIAAKASIAFVALGGSLIVLGQGLGAILTIVAAVKALGAAITAVRAMSMASLFTGLGAGIAVIAGLAYAFGLLGDKIGETSHAMQEQAQMNARQRSDDQLRMERLQQLADKQELSNDETKLAAALIETLQGRYGNLGISIDSVTGKIIGMTEAQNRLSTAMKAMEIADTQKALNESEKNLNILSGPNQTRLTWGEALLDEKAGQKRIQQARKDYDIELQRFRALEARLKALTGKAGDEDIGKTAAEIEKQKAAERKLRDERKKAGEKAVEDGKDAATDLAKIEDDRRRESLSKLDRDIEDAQRRGDDRKRLVDAVTAGRSAADPGMAPMHDHTANIRKGEIDADTEADIAEIRRKAADEELAKTEEARRGQLDEIARKELELKYAAKAGETQEQTARREHEKRLAMIALEQEQALKNAKDGLDPELIKKSFDADRALAEAEFGARNVGRAESQINAAGSFAAAIVGRIGQDSIEKQALTESQRQTALLRKIEKKDGGVMFGNG